MAGFLRRKNIFTGEVELSYGVADGHGGSVGAALEFTLAPDLSGKVAPTMISSESADDAITDTSGNARSGINDDTTFIFSTIPTNPALIWSNPLDDSTDFQIDHNIELYFNESIKAGNSGNIVISNGSNTCTISINDACQVTFDGYNGLTISPTNNLILNTNYSIKIDSGAITDLNGNPYTGISDDTTLNFTTTNSDSLLIFKTPSDDELNVPIESNVVSYFNEIITLGVGNSVITNSTDTPVIAANDGDQVTFNGSKVTISPFPKSFKACGYYGRSCNARRKRSAALSLRFCAIWALSNT